MLAKAYGTPYWNAQRGASLGDLGEDPAWGDFVDGSYFNPTEEFGDFFPAAGGGGGGFNWDRFSNITGGIVNDIAKLRTAFQPVPAGCTQVAGPYGTSVSCAQPGQPATAVPSVGGSLSSLFPWLLLIGGGVVAVKVLGSKS